MVINFAHRGSLTEAPENTIAAMEKALNHGAKAIELDVQLTKDKELIVIHDHHLKRFNKAATKLVKDYTLAEIKQIDIGASFSPQFAGERLASLNEILEMMPRDILLNIEIKNAPVMYDGLEAILLACLHRHHRLEYVIISSFDHQCLETVQQLEPNMPIGLLLNQRIVKPWEYAQHSGLQIYSIHPNKIHVDTALITGCHQAGYRVYPYTVNDFAMYEQFVAWGIDGVFSNNPDIFKTR